MAILKLNKLSPYPYAGLVLLPGNNNVPDEYVEELMANPICADEFERGVFELVEGDADAAKPVEITDSEPPLLPEKSFDEMNGPELDAACRKRGIDIKGIKKNADKLAVLMAHAEASK